MTSQKEKLEEKIANAYVDLKNNYFKYKGPKKEELKEKIAHLDAMCDYYEDTYHKQHNVKDQICTIIEKLKVL